MTYFRLLFLDCTEDPPLLGLACGCQHLGTVCWNRIFTHGICLGTTVKFHWFHSCVSTSGIPTSQFCFLYISIILSWLLLILWSSFVHKSDLQYKSGSLSLSSCHCSQSCVTILILCLFMLISINLSISTKMLKLRWYLTPLSSSVCGKAYADLTWVISL